MVEYERNAWWWHSPGFTSFLDRNGIHYDIIDLDLLDFEAGPALPDPTRYKAVFVFGGPDSANDENIKMLTEIEMI
jgi:hypothetical protein